MLTGLLGESTNGILKQWTLGTYSKSPADFNLNDKQAAYFQTASDVIQNTPLPIEGGGNFSPRVVLSGGGGGVLKPVTNLQVKIETIVLANASSGTPVSASSSSSSSSGTTYTAQ
ncbi:hypothetical protein [Chitinophaga sp. HK235]|uniref:hypothetical protein n=1 Tax=Chitinophaga sp. HK235 TaxID=2952571 RepID=UPI001BA6A8CC|nr:hypothetical protein [Chitinophaga sp. HK235]